ncbi:response regulator [Microscilla marina]|uniref:Two-component hybrid sensor and regulator n=1 Tax=Microscilla marina ATCC 23134 TaxID=313606 RepID=A1ZFP9_MICM2|nr:response regulator [Microscilla marina]EAY30823.1 two-component hybrid sensor and regulator [Microscilla marina ATCC 23134]
MKEYRVLAIDDEQYNLDVYLQLFEDKTNYELMVANNGTMGYEIAIELLPDLIITDWQMPDIDGITLITKFKAEKNTQDIPIIVATGAMTSPKDLKTALTSGAIDYVRKPIDEVELLARVNVALRLAAAYAEVKLAKEQQQRQLATLTLQSNHKDKLLTQIQQKLEQAPISVKPFLKPIIKEISSEVRFSQDWDSFKMHFEQVHPQFFARLQRKYAELTPYELKFCAYTKMNLSTKEIADLLNITPRSTQVTRGRIKKKMGLDKTCDFREYFLKY